MVPVETHSEPSGMGAERPGRVEPSGASDGRPTPALSGAGAVVEPVPAATSPMTGAGSLASPVPWAAQAPKAGANTSTYRRDPQGLLGCFRNGECFFIAAHDER